MEIFKKNWLLILFSLIAVVLFREWFSFKLISAGDYWPLLDSMKDNYKIYPFAWYFNQGNGLGGSSVYVLWVIQFTGFEILIFSKFFGASMQILSRLGIFFPLLFFLTITPIFLFKNLFPKNKLWILSPFIYSLNTYILTVIGGGQMVIALAYSLSPMVLYLFIKSVNVIVDNFKINSFKLAILTGIAFSFQVMFELRIAYVILLAGFLYWLIRFVTTRGFKVFLKAFVFTFIIPGILSLGIHAFWLFPTIILHQNGLSQLGDAYTTIKAVKFFSFAKFENSISLLHPNWPENIFGKVGFMKPEFLLLPILAFAALFFIKKNGETRKKTYVIFFALLGIIGSFLAKGSNEPFGAIYLWMFNHVPGFIMFRDPTKWYTLVAISFSILIPFTIYRAYEWIRSQPKFQISNFKFQINSKNQILNLQNLFLLFIVFCLLYLIRPALFGQLGGTFKTTHIPNEYTKLENFFSSQKSFFRTFWVPSMQRFGLNSVAHPAISSMGFYEKYDIQEVLNELKKEKTEKVLAESAVRYIVVPYDSEGEIYLEDRKYNSNINQKLVNEIKQIPYLKQVDGFGKIAVFEVSYPRDHFWSTNENLIKSYRNINPTKYKVDIQNAKKGDIIVFAESYDPNWIAINGNVQINSMQYNKRFNSFTLLKNGNHQLEVYYAPQKYVEIGLAVSLVTFVSVAVLLVASFKRNKSS